MSMYRNVFPLSALIAQDELKLSLMLNAVNPGVGGVLIRGEKGTAKSTAVRALAALLPEIEVVKGCAFSCDPAKPDQYCPVCRKKAPAAGVLQRQVRVVNLPLNATEDRVAGGIDFAAAIKNGCKALSPGLLAEAHRGVLYVDEVNLLDDHIVDVILDAAASGENRLEREGVSFSHPAAFILIGTMNPEEGELRPQLLDRFGLCVEISGVTAPEARVRLMIEREEYDQDKASFCRRFEKQSADLARQIAEGRARLPQVRVPRQLRGFISELCLENHVSGHRADLVIEQAARALAALQNQPQVTVDHIGRVAPLVLLHRRRDAQTPPPPPPPDDSPDEREDQPQSEQPPDKEQQQEEPRQVPPAASQDTEEKSEPSRETPPQPRNADDKTFEIGATFKVKSISATKDRVSRRGSGRRSRTRVSQKQGRYVKSSFANGTGDIALDATLRAAAPYQIERRSENGLAVCLTARDVREKVREKRIGNFLLFLVDASGSMGARGRMAASKGAVMSLLLDAYQKRDKVGLISFRRQEAVVNLPPTPSVELAGKLLADMPVGGRTPLSAGLAKTYEQVRNYLLKEPTARPIVILITDGKSNVALGSRNPVEEAMALGEAMARDGRIKFIVVDTEEPGMVTFGLARRLAATLEADYFKIEDLKTRELVSIAKGWK